MPSKPDWFKTKNIQKLFKLLAQNGGEGRIVGGAVRDHLLGVAIGDVDFCSTHTPQQLIEIAQNNNIRYIETGVDFGTVTLILDKDIFEVTSLRQDVETDGRHAKVIYGTSFKQDALRRDFTFNALYMNEKGEISDPLGSGIKHLKARKIKFIGNATQRIEEDYLRILRYFRFIARFGFNIDDEDFAQIKPLTSGLKKLSAERILGEFRRIYANERVMQTVKLMTECDVFKQLFSNDANFKQLEYFELNISSINSMWLIKLNLSLPNVSNQLISKRLKLSNNDQKYLNQMNRLVGILNLSDEDMARQIYINGKNMVIANLIYFAAKDNLDSIKLNQKLSYAEKFEIPILPIRGADLFTLGIEAGPEMGKLIKRLESQWLESDFKLTKQELLKAI